MENKSPDMVLFGLSQKSVTPDKSISLAGLGPRMSQGVLDDLYVRAACLEHGQTSLVLIALDLIWVSRTFVDNMRTWIKETLDIPRENVLICATHTHSGPQIRENTFDGSSIDAEYVKFLEELIREAVREACGSLKQGTLEISVGSTSRTMNRRKTVIDYEALKRFRLEKHVANRPNPKGPRDKTITALNLRSLNGDLKAVFFNFACHASMHRAPYVSSDLPGSLETALTKATGQKCAFFFLQGFTGNVRAALTRSRSLFAGACNVPGYLYGLFFDRHLFVDPKGREEMDEFADRVIEDFLSSMRRRTLSPAFSCGEKEISLPLQQPRPREYFEKLARTGNNDLPLYARHVLKTHGQTSSVPFKVQRVSLAGDCCLMGMEGEIFAEYALFLRGLGAGSVDILPVSCAGGMAGYIPTAEALAQGGYEPERSLRAFGLPAKFSPEIEGMIREAGELLFLEAHETSRTPENEKRRAE